MVGEGPELPSVAELELTRKIRNRLGSAWQPFFGGFGRLTPVQLRVIPEIFKGNDVIACSPTASGKTEAALAPLARKVLAAGDLEKGGLRVLYVVPTRALVNNIDHRMRGPLRDVGLRLAVRTGDRPEVSITNPEDVLVTTPESFDSLLCRYPKLWERLSAVVLDEIHLLDGTYRGDQLRVLLRRLLHEREGEVVQTVALSATLHDPAAVAERYMTPEATIVDVGGARASRTTVVETLSDVVATLREEELHKALVFCNRRKEVEETAVAFRDLWPKDRIAVHHGSLSRKERESVEAAMRSWRWGICVATMTLELGIDIGDIDAVVLFRPPPTPSSYQQRLGRACRRLSTIRVIGVAHDDEERDLFQAYAELARDGIIEATDYSPDLSVVVQQILSVLFQKRRGVTRAELLDLVSLLADEGVARLILSYLTEHEYVRVRAGHLFAGDRTLDLGQRGSIHSNIADTRELTLIDTTTGKELGKATVATTPGARFLFAGRAWMVREVRGPLVLLVPIPREQLTAWFKAHLDVGAFDSLLPEELRA